MQNKYYWVILEIVWAEFGYTKQEMHEFFKNEFLGEWHYMSQLKKEILVVKDTSSLTVAEFRDYVEQIIIWASNNGIVIPDAEKEVFIQKI